MAKLKGADGLSVSVVKVKGNHYSVSSYDLQGTQQKQEFDDFDGAMAHARKLVGKEPIAKAEQGLLGKAWRWVLKATQLGLFDRKPVQAPGSRGSTKWWRDDTGAIRYDEKPVPQLLLPAPRKLAGGRPERRVEREVRSILSTGPPPGGWKESDKVHPDPVKLQAEIAYNPNDEAAKRALARLQLGGAILHVQAQPVDLGALTNSLTATLIRLKQGDKLDAGDLETARQVLARLKAEPTVDKGKLASVERSFQAIERASGSGDPTEELSSVR
jgi:hypothetical protein